MAIELYTNYKAEIQQRHDVHCHWDRNDMDSNKAKTYAMVGCLKTFQFDREHRSAFVIKHFNQEPIYRFINENTIQTLTKIIDNIFYGKNAENVSEDSQMPFRWMTRIWEQLGFEFVTAPIRNPMDPPIQRRKRTRENKFVVRGEPRARAGGCFPFINTGPEDLSRLGIFNKFDPKNYEVHCLITALHQPKQISTLLQSMIRVRYVPTEYLTDISQIIGKKIFLHSLNGTVAWFGENKVVKNGVNIFYYPGRIVGEGHYMKWENDLERTLNKLKPHLRPMTIEEDNRALIVRKVYDILPYPKEAYCKQLFIPSGSFWSTKSFFFLLENVSEQQMDHFTYLMNREFGVDPKHFYSAANFVRYLFNEELRDVVWFRGYIAKQIKWCQPHIIMGSCEIPLKAEGNFVALDINASYTFCYTTFTGIPIGTPTFKPTDEAKYFYLKVQVKNWKSKHASDPFPLLNQPATYWLDKTMFDVICEHYDWEYEVLGGWYFRNVENTIRDKALKLWELALQNRHVRHLIKYCLNCSYGKSMQKEKKANENGLPKPVLMQWSQPQFGVNVKSWGRKIIQEIVYKAVDLGVQILYANTDSIFVREEDAQKLVDEGVITVVLNSKLRSSLRNSYVSRRRSTG
jgi:hypothetical protein